MEKLHITEEEKKLLEIILPEQKVQDEYFKLFHPLRTIISDELIAKNTFSKGMMMQLYLHNTDLVKQISKDETVLLLQKTVEELEEKLIEEKKLSKETIKKFKDNADLKMRKLEDAQDKYYHDLRQEMRKKLKLNRVWIISASIAVLITLAEFVYIITKI